MKNWLISLPCLLMVSAAIASTPTDPGQRSEASMLVTGTLELEPAGKVSGYTIDQQNKLPAEVVKLVRQNLPTWRFAPEANVSGTITTRMKLRVVARPMPNGLESITISSAQFGGDDGVPAEHIHWQKRTRPVYPNYSLRSRVSGTVYLLLKVGRDGRVENVATEQVNLTVYASEHEMSAYRSDLSHAALAAARQWTFDPPTAGRHVADPFWLVRIPVTFNMARPNETRPIIKPSYGQWIVYMPGPRIPVPWLQGNAMASAAPDMVAEGSIRQYNESPRLLTVLGGL